MLGLGEHGSYGLGAVDGDHSRVLAPREITGPTGELGAAVRERLQGNVGPAVEYA